MLVGGVVVVLVVALAFLVPLGSFAVDERQSSTAADAAALAAVTAWRDSLRGVYDGMGSAGSDAEFYALVGRGLGTFLPGSAQAYAESFAARNDAELIGFSVNGARGTVTVTVRSRDVIPGTGQRAESTATARLRFVGGLCAGGGRLGVVLGGVCVSSSPPPPTPTPTPTPDPDDPPPPPVPVPPYAVPGGMRAFDVEAVLTTG